MVERKERGKGAICDETVKGNVKDESFRNFETQLPTPVTRIERMYVIKR